MTSKQTSHKSIRPALGGLVALLVVIMVAVFTGFNQQERHLKHILLVSDLSESVSTMERQLMDGYRFLSLSSDDLLGSSQGNEAEEFVADFHRRLVEMDSLNRRVRASSVLTGIEQGVLVTNQIENLGQSWGRVIDNIENHPAEATVELITVSDPLSVSLLTSDLPSLASNIRATKLWASARYDRVSRLVFVIILLVFLAAYVISLILISHILNVEKERHAMESDLREAMEQAKSASHEKSRFLSNMSHELRTPMNGVIGMANVLASQDLPSNQQRMVTVLKESADSALSLVNDILDFEAIEAGKVAVESRTFEMANVTRRIQALARAQLVEKPIDFSMSVDTNVPRRVSGDEGRLIQVLTNLVSNAIKFTEEGTVDVLVQQEAGARISFIVRDTGIGIDPDRLDSLFESFKQADNSIRRRYGGTGLGLSITRSLVHMMEGSINVISMPGDGSIFEVVLPLPAVTSPMLEKVDDSTTLRNASGAVERITVLCVDDNLINLEVARVIIEEAGHACIQASSGREGLGALSKHSVDVVLMDCHMDGLDGFETARRMMKLYPELPIVALTADATLSAVEDSQAAGMRGILMKPFKPEELIRTIEKMGSQDGLQGDVTADGVWSNSA